MQFGGMLAVLFGGYSTRIDIATPWLLGAVGEVLMAMAAVSFMRGEDRASHSFHPREIALRVRARMSDAIQSAVQNRAVMTLALANGITMAAWAPFWFEWPQYFNAAFNRGTQMAAWVYCLTSIATMLGAEFIARRQPDPAGRPTFISIAVGLQSIALIAAGVVVGHGAWVLILFLGSTVCAGVSQPVYMAWYNEQIDESHRATLLSFQSTCARLGAAVGLPLGGKIADAYGFGITWQVAGVIALLAAPCYAMLSAQAGRVSGSAVPTAEE
jgi:predicted MFS family arabinose efflux permease